MNSLNLSILFPCVTKDFFHINLFSRLRNSHTFIENLLPKGVGANLFSPTSQLFSLSVSGEILAGRSTKKSNYTQKRTNINFTRSGICAEIYVEVRGLDLNGVKLSCFSEEILNSNIS